VSRQQFAGKHAQDRVDAEDWLSQWKPLVAWAREQPRQRVLPRREPFAAAMPKVVE
jgi:hypothetical protein